MTSGSTSSLTSGSTSDSTSGSASDSTVDAECALLTECLHRWTSGRFCHQYNFIPICNCSTVETTVHYLLHCPNFSNERLIFFNKLRSIDANILSNSRGARVEGGCILTVLGVLVSVLTYTKAKGYGWGFRKYMLDFLKFLAKLHFTDQNHHGPEFLKNTLHITCKLIAPHFSNFLHSYFVCILSKHDSNRKIIITTSFFLMWVIRTRISKKFCYICALNHPPYLSKLFKDC